MNKKNSISFSPYIIFGLISLLLIVTMLSLSYYDYEWTTFFRQHRNDAFRHLVENTLLKGQLPGLRDLSTLLLVGAGVLYLFSFIKPKTAKLRNLRPCCSLILISGLACLLFTHSIKNGMSRPRPKDVYAQKVEFSSWYEFGSDIVPHSTYRASMPSGHTTMVAVLISLAYAFFLFSKNMMYKISGILILLCTLILTMVMGISRAMSAHWVSDTIVSIFGCWSIIYIVYHHIGSRKISETSQAYLLADLQFCLRLVLFFIGLLLMLWGIHATHIKLCWTSFFILLIAPGVTLIVISIFKKNLYPHIISKNFNLLIEKRPDERKKQTSDI